MQRQPLAITTTYRGIANTLFTDVHISQAFDRSLFPKAPSPEDIGAKKFISIWDTGATGTVISQKTASQKDVLTTVYFASIILPNRIVIPQLRVIRGSIAGDADVLIGMDIINLGDFSVTNCEGKTVFSFRIPSIEAIDYVKQGQARVPQISSLPRKVGRNDPCPCGSGKKYKKCCGR
jgi:hypothetical protein